MRKRSGRESAGEGNGEERGEEEGEMGKGNRGEGWERVMRNGSGRESADIGKRGDRKRK